MTDAKIPGVTILPGVTYQPRTVNRGFGPFQTDISNSMFWDVQDRSRSYFFGGAAPSGAILRELQDAPSNNNPNIFAQQFSFGAADELELRTFERVNNPGTTSRLELAAGGRAEDYKNLSPLRDNRGLDIEKLSRLNLDEALFHAHIDMRQRLSVFGGASPLRAADATGSPDFINATTETKIDINALMARLHKPTVGSTTAGTERAEAVQEIFRLVSGALAPYAYEPSAANSNTIAWTSADGGALTQGMQLKGLAYGGDCEVPGAGSGQRAFAGIGPERALRIAAHFTANLVDGRESFDSFTPGGGTPIYLGDWASEFMLRLDGTPNFRNRLNSIIRYGTGSNEPEIFPAWESPNREVQYVTTAVQKPRMAVALNPSAAEDARLAPIATDILPPNAAAAPPSTQIGAQAINVYGIKPQPFLTQMSSITVYTDTPRDDANSDWMDPAGPDGDEPVDANQPPGPTNPPAQPNRQITIHGRVAADNPDYICEVVAFQLHNPFDTTLALTTAANEQGVSGTGAVLSFNLRHYVEFAGRYFAVADSSDRASFTTGEMKNVTLSPGETRTFYIIDQSFEAIEARMRRVDSNLTAMDAQTLLRDWINKQFSINFADQNTWPVRMAEINVGTLTAEPVSPMVGILNNTADPATTENFRQARLWSVVRVVNGEGSGAQINSPFNDVLVDRLRDPGPVGTVTLDRRLPSQQNEVAGSEDQSGNNKGLTIAMWGQVRRPQLPDGITLTRGVLPPWCVEVKSSLPEFGGGGDARWVRAEHVRSLNKANTDPVSGSLNWGDFQGGSNTGLRLVTPPGADATFPGGLFRQTAGAVEVTFTREPSKQTGNRLSTLPTTLPGAALGTNLSGVPFPQVQIPLLLPPPRSATVVRDAVLGQSYSNKRTYEQDTRPISQKLPQAPTLRPTDLLLTPAFGPSKNPSATIVIAGSRLDITDPRCYDVQWTTLAEAAALALDYDSPADNRDPDYRIGAVVTDLSQVQGCLDRGQLMADRFVPFTDRSGTTIGTFDTPVDANRDGINEQGDVPRGRGLPFAVALLDRFKFNKYGSETAMVHGVVNISTAPLAVKRVLPMLSPEPTLGWMGGGSLASDPFFDGTDADDPFDLAATLEAYGTRSRVRTRTTNGTNAGLVIDFRNDNDGGTFDPGAGVPFGRSFITGIGALRQEPGFAATAEVLVANQADVRPGEGTVAQNELDRRRRTSMDRLARDGVAFAIPQTPQADVYASGVAPYAYRAAPTGGGLPLTASLVVDDPSEKTALANALLNTISVRSDVFCAWFVVQGYTPADVDGLTAWTSTGNPPNEDRYRAPMTPSIQRRFVMVVDRSNVLSAGDKPKILMLEEVPFE
ncbi:MAG: hypothetical protein ACT4PL_00180 [Phycisphaerales bacterium]